jgi:hypothetical protein
MRFFIGVTSAFGAGIIVGLGLGAILSEDKFRKKYEEATASMKRAREMETEVKFDLNEVAQEAKPPPSGKVIEKGELHSWGPAKDGLGTIESVTPVKSTQSVQDFHPDETNPYHEPVHEPSDIRGDFTFLTEDDYHSDDEHEKSQIIVMMDSDGEPLFIENGAQIKDWEDKVGSRILGDFYQLIPPGQPQVLYIRNNITDVDYEVFREQP